jgi:hypothetical protein
LGAKKKRGGRRRLSLPHVALSDGSGPSRAAAHHPASATSGGRHRGPFGWRRRPAAKPKSAQLAVSPLLSSPAYLRSASRLNLSMLLRRPLGPDRASPSPDPGFPRPDLLLPPPFLAGRHAVPPGGLGWVGRVAVPPPPPAPALPPHLVSPTPWRGLTAPPRVWLGEGAWLRRHRRPLRPCHTSWPALRPRRGLAMPSGLGWARARGCAAVAACSGLAAPPTGPAPLVWPCCASLLSWSGPLTQGRVAGACATFGRVHVLVGVGAGLLRSRLPGPAGFPSARLAGLASVVAFCPLVAIPSWWPPAAGCRPVGSPALWRRWFWGGNGWRRKPRICLRADDDNTLGRCLPSLRRHPFPLFSPLR